MKYEQVIYDKEGHIARITLNRPEKRNAWTFMGGMTDDFHAAMREAEEDDDEVLGSPHDHHSHHREQH